MNHVFLQSDDDSKTTDNASKKQKLDEPAHFIAHVPVPSQKEVSSDVMRHQLTVPQVTLIN